MKTTKHHFRLAVALALFVASSSSIWAQNQPKKEQLEIDTTTNDVVMTWNKTTPDSEMKDDITALKKYGVTIKYAEVKRNTKNEITGLTVSYEDEKGNKGELKLNQKSPISTINFYKSGNEIGFGSPASSDPMSTFFFNGVPNSGAFKQFGFHDEEGNPANESLQFNFSDKNKPPKIVKKSKIVIKKPNRKDLIIEDGQVLSGADDYSTEEIEKIKSESSNQPEELDNSDRGAVGEFDLRNEKGVQEFKKKIKKMIGSADTDADAKSEMTKAKEEMVKAKEELEKARIALEKATESKLKKK